MSAELTLQCRVVVVIVVASAVVWVKKVRCRFRWRPWGGVRFAKAEVPRLVDGVVGVIVLGFVQWWRFKGEGESVANDRCCSYPI